MSLPPESAKSSGTVWSFDLGTGSLGEAIVENNIVKHLVPWMIVPTLASTQDARERRRAWRTRKAHLAREAWLDELWDNAGLKSERPKPRQVGKIDGNNKPVTGEAARKIKGPWQQVQDPDYRIEREFAPSGIRPQKDEAPMDNTLYTSCLLRIKLLQGGDGMENWQVYKALRAALQSRGQQTVPWAKKEAARDGKSIADIEAKERQELAKKDPAYQQAMGAWNKFENKDAAHWKDLPNGKEREDYLFPCYYDAWKMGFWPPDKPDLIKPDEPKTLHTYLANSTRQVVFPGEKVEVELFKLAENAAKKIPALNDAKAIIQSFIKGRVEKLNKQREVNKKAPLNEEEIEALPRAKNFAELFVYGPAGKPSQEDPNKPVRALALSDPAKCKALALRPGTDFDWKAAIGQKIPRFENRIISRCALFPRLKACKVAPRLDKDRKTVRPESLLAAQVIFLLQAKNLKVIEKGQLRFLEKAEIAELLKETEKNTKPGKGKNKEEQTPQDTPASILERYKLTETTWKEWCKKEELDGTPSIPVKQTTGQANDGADAAESSGKSKDVIKAPALDGRCRYSRPALSLLKYLLLNAEDGDENNPNALLEKVANGKEKVPQAKAQSPQGSSENAAVDAGATKDSLAFVVVEELPKKQKGHPAPVQEDSSGGGGFSRPLSGPPDILKSEIQNLIGRLWKPQKDEKGAEIPYAPHQLTIPDLSLDDVATEGEGKLPHAETQSREEGKDGLYKQRVDALVEAVRAWTEPPTGAAIDDAPEPIDKAAEAYWEHRKRITDLIGEQNNPIVRDRLTRFWGRLCRMQHPAQDTALADNVKSIREQTVDAKRNETDKVKLKQLQRRLAALQDLHPGMGLSAPDFVTLEFAREDNNSLYGAKRKKRVKDFQNAQEKKREAAKKELEKRNKVSETNITKYLLWEEQGKKDLYSGEGLGCTNYLECEIDHIVPRSIGGPDAFYNLTLTSKGNNKNKANRTPWRWFQECKTTEWDAYTKRVTGCKTLSKRKKELLLSERAEQLVEQTRDLNDTAWIARIAQKVVRLHFGWPHESTAGANQRIRTVNGGLTARIRRRYALNALLDETKRSEVWAVIKEMMDLEEKLETLRNEPERDEQEVGQKKEDLKDKRQQLRELADGCAKNRADRRHHALDALVLSFIPNWAGDATKEDFFRFPESIGDRPAIVEWNKKEVNAQSTKIEKARYALEAFRKKGQLNKAEEEKREDLEQQWFKADKARRKLLLPPNIANVWIWFAKQILDDHELKALEDFPSEESA